MPRRSIFNQTALPDSSGEVYLDAFANHGTPGRWDQTVLVLEESTAKISISGSFDVPSDYASGANHVIAWTAAAIAGDVEWEFRYRVVPGNDTDSLDQAGEDEEVVGEDTAPSAAFERLERTFALTDGNFSAGATVQWELSRDGTDGGDDMSDEALVFDAFFEYAA